MLVELLGDCAKSGHALHAPASIWLISGWKVFGTHGIELAALHQYPGAQLAEICVEAATSWDVVRKEAAAACKLSAGKRKADGQNAHVSRPSKEHHENGLVSFARVRAG